MVVESTGVHAETGPVVVPLGKATVVQGRVMVETVVVGGRVDTELVVVVVTVWMVTWLVLVKVGEEEQDSDILTRLKHAR